MPVRAPARAVLAATALAACLAAVPAHADPFNYGADFASGAGAEWAISGFNSGAAGILGELASGPAVLSLNTTGPGSSSLAFDLLGFRTVDGFNCCTDTFSLTINGTLVFQGVFQMGGGGSEGVPLNLLGATVSGSGMSRQIAIPAFTLLSGANSMEFAYGPMQGFGDEAWGLDNVLLSGTVTPAVPEPASAVLGLLGLAGLGLVRRRRRH